MVYQDDVLRMDTESRQVTARGAAVELTPTEFLILCLLVGKAGATIPAGALAEAVWGPGAAKVQTSTLRVHMSRLREKLRRAGAEPRAIRGMWGAGYRYEPPMSGGRDGRRLG